MIIYVGKDFYKSKEIFEGRKILKSVCSKVWDVAFQLFVFFWFKASKMCFT